MISFFQIKYSYSNLLDETVLKVEYFLSWLPYSGLEAAEPAGLLGPSKHKIYIFRDTRQNCQNSNDDIRLTSFLLFNLGEEGTRQISCLLFTPCVALGGRFFPLGKMCPTLYIYIELKL